MTRINIEILEEIHKQLKIEAALKETTIKDLIAQILKNKVEKEIKENNINFSIENK